MWIADQWKDYEVLDTSKGEKLERWGQYRLIRPDPQVIWDTPRNRAWRRPNAHYHRSKKGGGEWEFFDLPDDWCIHYKDLTFRLKPFSFKHTGLFPEQAVNWDWFSELIRRRVSAGQKVRVLNLFAYTGGATAAAAAAGAEVTHVDASKGMVGWAKENAQLSGLGDAHIRWLVDDCGKFVEREIRRGNHYDAIIMDPPSYGRTALCPAQFLYYRPAARCSELYAAHGSGPQIPRNCRRRRSRPSRVLQRTGTALRRSRKVDPCPPVNQEGAGIFTSTLTSLCRLPH